MPQPLLDRHRRATGLKGLLTLVTVVIVLAIIKAALAALLVILAIGLLVSFAISPRETLIYLASLLILGLASARPGTCIVVFGILALAMVAVDALRKPRRRLLLTDGREHRSPGPGRLDRDLLG